MWLNEAPSLTDGATRFQRADVCVCSKFGAKKKNVHLNKSFIQFSVFNVAGFVCFFLKQDERFALCFLSWIYEWRHSTHVSFCYQYSMYEFFSQDFSHDWKHFTRLALVLRKKKNVFLRRYDLSRWIFLQQQCPLTTRNGARHKNKNNRVVIFFLTAFY